MRRSWAWVLAAICALLSPMAAAQRTNIDALIDEARTLGRDDRNAEAARAWARVLALAPARRAEIVPPLAWQLLWSGQAAQAEALFDEWQAGAESTAARSEALDGLAQARQAQGRQAQALATFIEAAALVPDNLRLQRRLATSLLWNDRHAEAVSALERLQRRTPDERELGWMLANAYNFAGRHTRALAEFQRWGPARNNGERLDLARALYWAGDSDAAAPLLAEQSDAAGVQLRDARVGRERAAFAYATLDQAEDRDGLHSRAALLGFGVPLGSGQALEVNARRLRLREDGQAVLNGQQLEASYRVRLGGWQQPMGTAWVSAALRPVHIGGWSPLTGTLRLRWVPQDLWRVDAEIGRELVETPRAIAQRVILDVASISAEHRPDARWMFAGAATTQHFDDGTSRLRLNARSEATLHARPRWVMGVEGGWLERTASPASGVADRGYWNPRRYTEARFTTALVHEVPGHEFYARIGVGRSHEWGEGGASSSGSPQLWEFGWTIDPSARWRARLAMGGSGQGFGVAGRASGTGYWRRYVNVSLNTYRF